MAQSCYPGRDLLWYYYEEEFLNQDRATTHNNKGEIGEKKANGMIYDKILEVLLFFVKKRSEETGLRLPEDTPAKAEEDDPFIKIFEYLEERQNETSSSEILVVCIRFHNLHLNNLDHHLHHSNFESFIITMFAKMVHPKLLQKNKGTIFRSKGYRDFFINDKRMSY
ncbi:unnamed protein product [Rhizophagus irregularis]|nr:unnamed protein product [Rhizophagus irregularis]